MKRKKKKRKKRSLPEVELLEVLLQAHIGIKGTVMDKITGEPISEAVIWVKNSTEITPIKHPVTSCKFEIKLLNFELICHAA